MPSILSPIGETTTQHNEQMSQLGTALAGVLKDEMPKPTAVPVTEEIPDDDGLLAESGLLPEGEEVDEEELMAEGEEVYVDDLPAGAKERAEALGVDAGFFYETEYTLQDGTVMTVGEMKDQIQGGGGDIQKQQQDILAQQQHMQAQTALNTQYGEPIRRHKDALEDISKRYQETNWKELTDEHGDKAELARVQMQQRYTQIQHELGQMEGEYQKALGGYATHVAQEQLKSIVKTHPTWSDMAVANAELQGIHTALASTGITFEQMTNEIGGVGGPVKLAILELAAKGAAAGGISKKKVRRVAKSLKGGRTISAKQQQRMQRAKKVKGAVGGTRQQQQAAAIQLIQDNGGL